MNKAILASVAGLVLAMGVAACSSESEPPAGAAPATPEGLLVSEARMNIPAASGNPAVVYLTLVNGSDDALILQSATVAGAESATLHSTVNRDGQMDMAEIDQLSIAAGETVAFEPGGKHVMVMGLPDGLEAGGEIEVTLFFAPGSQITFPAQLLAPGDDGGF